MHKTIQFKQISSDDFKHTSGTSTGSPVVGGPLPNAGYMGKIPG